MKNNWEPVLWESWSALALCAASVLPPGSPFGRTTGIVWPGLALAVLVPTAWALWGLWAQPQTSPGPEQLLEPAGALSEPVREAVSACDLAVHIPA
ncbi:MAG: peptidoglycan synthetase [Faecalibacterium sp.]